MLLTVLKSKLHRVKVTDANINYIGSITIDGTLMGRRHGLSLLAIL